MSELTMQELLAALVERRTAEEALCRGVGVDLQQALAAAKCCGVQLLKLSQTFPDDWWLRLEREARRRHQRFEAAWRHAVASTFREILSAGDGPVSAFDQGLDFVRDQVPPGLLQRCDEWTPETGGLLLHGGSEVGKTMALLALAWRQHDLANHEVPPYTPYLDREPRCPVLWVQAVKLAKARDTWSFGTDRPELEVACERADLLVIDDLLFAKHGVAVILEVVAVRMNHGRPTLTSSGFGEAELVERLGDAGFRRLTHCGGAPGQSLEVRRPRR